MKLDFAFTKNVVKDNIKNCVAWEKKLPIASGGNFLTSHGYMGALCNTLQ